MLFAVIGFTVLFVPLVLALRQPEDTPVRWRRWLRRVPVIYTVSGTAAILLGFLGQLVRDVNLPLRCCFYVPLAVFGAAAIFHDSILRGWAYSRARFGFSLLGLAALTVGVLSQVGPASVEPIAPREGDVRILQWNVHWGGQLQQDKWETLRAEIVAREPDIVVLNEAPFESKGWVEAMVAEQGWHLCRAGTSDENPWGCQLAVCSRWPVEAEVAEPVYNGHVLLVRVERPGRRLRVLAIDAESNVVRESREPFLDDVRRRLALAHLAGQTVDVVAGDFNTPGRSVAFDRMGEPAGGYVRAAQFAPGWRATWPAKLPLYDIDHVWVHRAWGVRGCELFTNLKTDHRGQVVTLGPPVEDDQPPRR